MGDILGCLQVYRSTGWSACGHRATHMPLSTKRASGVAAMSTRTNGLNKSVAWNARDVLGTTAPSHSIARCPSPAVRRPNNGRRTPTTAATNVGTERRCCRRRLAWATATFASRVVIQTDVAKAAQADTTAKATSQTSSLSAAAWAIADASTSQNWVATNPAQDMRFGRIQINPGSLGRFWRLLRR